MLAGGSDTLACESKSFTTPLTMCFIFVLKNFIICSNSSSTAFIIVQSLVMLEYKHLTHRCVGCEKKAAGIGLITVPAACGLRPAANFAAHPVYIIYPVYTILYPVYTIFIPVYTMFVLLHCSNNTMVQIWYKAVNIVNGAHTSVLITGGHI